MRLHDEVPIRHREVFQDPAKSCGGFVAWVAKAFLALLAFRYLSEKAIIETQRCLPTVTEFAIAGTASDGATVETAAMPRGGPCVRFCLPRAPGAAAREFGH